MSYIKRYGSEHKQKAFISTDGNAGYGICCFVYSLEPWLCYMSCSMRKRAQPHRHRFLRGLNKFSRVSVNLYKGDNFHDFFFASLHTKPSERGLLLKERICSQGEQILSLKSKPLFRMEVK